MPKPKAPAWLTKSFADGIDDRHSFSYVRDPTSRAKVPRRAYPTAHPRCWLAHHDPKRLPCNFGARGTFEHFHFIGRQVVERAMGAALPTWQEIVDPPASQVWWFPAELVLLAAWDPRNGELGCEHHHRRFDSHADSSRAPAIVVPAFALPEHFDQFVTDYGLEQQAEDRFAGAQDPDRAYLWTP